MTSSPLSRLWPIAAAALALFFAGAQAPGQAPETRPADLVRTIDIPGSPARAVLWTAANGGPVNYVVTEDGISYSRPAQADPRLYLRYQTFDPLVDRLDIPDDLRADPRGRLYIVQYWTQGLAAYRSFVAGLGGDILFHMPRHANVVAMDPGLAEVVAGLPFVRAVSPFHPAFRLEPELRALLASGRAGSVKVNLLTTRRGPVAQGPVAAWVRAQGGTVVHVSKETYLMTVTLPSRRLGELAGLEQVQWVDRWTPIESEGDMDIARAFHGANHIETQVNALGQGVRVEVLDGGCDENHPDMQNFLVHSPTNTPSSHGSACSGIVLGSGAGNSAARGAMPLATLMIGDYSYYAGGSRYAHSAELVNASLSYQCVLQSNSWGNTRTFFYTSISQDVDTILFDLEDLSILQSQSNAGNQDSRPQAWAKNIISVGGIRHANTLSKGDDSWNFGASIGPAADGRIKPDLASFYDSILCADWSGSSGYSSGNYTSSFGGTSGATPIVAGHLGLYYQLWHGGTFGNTPGSSVFDSRPKNTTAKAFAIATAKQWTFSGSGADLARVKQGWGHPDLQKMYDNAGDIFWVDETDVLGNLQSTTYDLDVTGSTAELKATMVYRDPGGTTSSTLHRINNLDLRVTSPSGTIYHGNNGLNSANYSASGGSANNVDTVENVFVANPQAGTWQVTVTAASLNQDSHPETGAVDADYALVVLGATPGTGPTLPNPPSDLAAIATSASSIQLTWTDNSSNEAAFELQRATGGGSFSTIANLAANTNGHLDTGLATGTSYSYRVRATNSAGSSTWSNTATETTQATAPAAPSNLGASATGATTIDLNWVDNASSETGFELERSTSAGGPFSNIANLGANATNFGDTGLTASTPYFYRARATNSGGNSAWSNTASSTTSAISPPATPSGLGATATGQATITVSWTDNSGDEDGFELQRATAAAGPFSTIANLGANANAFGDTGLSLATTYYYRVRGFNAGGTSAWSNTGNATTQGVTAPSAPSGLSAAATGQTTIDVSWGDNSGDEDGFELQRATALAGPFGTIASLGVNATNYGDTGLTPTTTYYYRVRAFNAGGNSAWSNTANATTQSPPSTTDYSSDRGRLRKGTQTGSHTDTHGDDGVYHQLTEHLYRSNRSRHNFDYYFDGLPSGTKTLHISAHHTASSDNEDWKVQYRDGGSWVDLVVITKTTDDGSYQTAVIPNTGSGNFRIRVRDIDRSSNQPVLDSCFVDHLFIRM